LNSPLNYTPAEQDEDLKSLGMRSDEYVVPNEQVLSSQFAIPFDNQVTETESA